MTPEKVFRIASLVLLGGLVVMRGYFSLRVRQAGERLLPDREAVEREGKGAFLLRVVSFFVLIGILVSYASDLPWVVVLSFPLPVFLRWTGFAIGVAAVLLWTWTQAALRTAWSPQLQLREEHHLVTTGPYSRVRHPLYTATMCFGVGFALVTANWFFALMTALSIWFLPNRVAKEERMMIDRFGEEYREYVRRTGRFLPKW